MTAQDPRPSETWRSRLHEVIFEADTSAGKAFDVALLWCILLSVLAVLLESVPGIRARHAASLRAAEWTFTVLFTIEYVLRLSCVGRPGRYARSFFGIVDLLAIVPTYLSVLIPGAQTLLVIRSLRLLRIFRIFKLARFLDAGRVLRQAIWASRHKISVFLGTVLTLVLIIGAVMHLIEGPKSGFDSIPRGMYWAIVTLTTVGYGNIAPTTAVGQALASVVMILGYGIIAVPTGIVTVALAQAGDRKVTTQSCPQCSAEGHDTDAAFCKYCGGKL
jgi:voltage-gated potassium channel